MSKKFLRSEFKNPSSSSSGPSSSNPFKEGNEKMLDELLKQSEDGETAEATTEDRERDNLDFRRSVKEISKRASYSVKKRQTRYRLRELLGKFDEMDDDLDPSNEPTDPSKKPPLQLNTELAATVSASSASVKSPSSYFSSSASPPNEAWDSLLNEAENIKNSSSLSANASLKINPPPRKDSRIRLSQLELVLQKQDQERDNLIASRSESAIMSPYKDILVNSFPMISSEIGPYSESGDLHPRSPDHSDKTPKDWDEFSLSTVENLIDGIKIMKSASFENVESIMEIERKLVFQKRMAETAIQVIKDTKNPTTRIQSMAELSECRQRITSLSESLFHEISVHFKKCKVQNEPQFSRENFDIVIQEKDQFKENAGKLSAENLELLAKISAMEKDLESVKHSNHSAIKEKEFLTLELSSAKTMADSINLQHSQEVNSLHEKIQALASSLELAKNERDDLESQLTELKESKAENVATIEALEKQVEAQTLKIEDITKIQREKDDMVRLMEDELASSNNQALEMQEKTKELEGRLLELAAFQEIANEFMSGNLDPKILREHLSSVDRVKDMEAEIKGLQETIDKVTGQPSEEWQTNFQQLFMEKEELAKEVNVLKTEKQENEARFALLINERDELKRKTPEGQDKRIKKLEMMLNEKNDLVEDLQLALSNVKQSISDHFDELVKENKQLASDLKEAKDLVEDYEEELHRLEKISGELPNDTVLLKEKIINYEHIIDKLDQELANMQRQRSNEKEAANTSTRNSLNNREFLERQLQALKKEHSDLKELYGNLKREHEKSVIQISDLTEKALKGWKQNEVKNPAIAEDIYRFLSEIREYYVNAIQFECMEKNRLQRELDQRIMGDIVNRS